MAKSMGMAPCLPFEKNRVLVLSFEGGGGRLHVLGSSGGVTVDELLRYIR